MQQLSFHAFAHRAQQSSRRGVNPKLSGGPFGEGGPGVCTSSKPLRKRKPRPVDQLPLPLGVAA